MMACLPSVLNWESASSLWGGRPVLDLVHSFYVGCRVAALPPWSLGEGAMPAPFAVATVISFRNGQSGSGAVVRGSSQGGRAHVSRFRCLHARVGGSVLSVGWHVSV